MARSAQSYAALSLSGTALFRADPAPKGYTPALEKAEAFDEELVRSTRSYPV
jgi:hypothetical protein